VIKPQNNSRVERNLSGKSSEQPDDDVGKLHQTLKIVRVVDFEIARFPALVERNNKVVTYKESSWTLLRDGENRHELILIVFFSMVNRSSLTLII